MSDRTPSCCKHRGVFFADGIQLCPRHQTPEQRHLVDELDRRAEPILGTKGWPYGPNIDVPTRERMLQWAEGHGVSLADTRCQGLHWLRVGRCGVSRCTRLGSWMDHVTRWKRNGKPALLVAQPYGLGREDLRDLDQLALDDDLYLFVGGRPWYGHGTVLVEVWNGE